MVEMGVRFPLPAQKIILSLWGQDYLFKQLEWGCFLLGSELTSNDKYALI